MTDRATDGRTEAHSVERTQSEPEVPEAVATTERYETDEGVVLYDAENPLAWVQTTEAVRLDEAR